MLFELFADLYELAICLCVHPRQGVDGLRRADTGNHVLALGVHKVLAVEAVLAVGRIAREGHARAAVVAHVPKDHRLDVDARAHQSANVVELAVLVRAGVVPTAEHRVDAVAQLLAGVLGEGLTGVLVGLAVLGDDFLKPLDVQVRVQLGASTVLDGMEGLLEMGVLDAQHHVAEHLNEAAVGVPGESFVAGQFDEGL